MACIPTFPQVGEATDLLEEAVFQRAQGRPSSDFILRAYYRDPEPHATLPVASMQPEVPRFETGSPPFSGTGYTLRADDDSAHTTKRPEDSTGGGSS